MEIKSLVPAFPSPPSDEVIREYAYRLYEQSDRASGHDLDNWLEATACLKANIPEHRTGARLQLYLDAAAEAEPDLLAVEARVLSGPRAGK